MINFLTEPDISVINNNVNHNIIFDLYHQHLLWWFNNQLTRAVSVQGSYITTFNIFFISTSFRFLSSQILSVASPVPAYRPQKSWVREHPGNSYIQDRLHATTVHCIEKCIDFFLSFYTFMRYTQNETSSIIMFPTDGTSMQVVFDCPAGSMSTIDNVCTPCPVGTCGYSCQVATTILQLLLLIINQPCIPGYICDKIGSATPPQLCPAG